MIGTGRPPTRSPKSRQSICCPRGITQAPAALSRRGHRSTSRGGSRLALTDGAAQTDLHHPVWLARGDRAADFGSAGAGRRRCPATGRGTADSAVERREVSAGPAPCLEPAHADRCRRILAIPTKRHERRPIAYLGRDEIDAVVAAPNPATWIGRRDRLLLVLAIQTGLRVSELIQLRCADVMLGTGAHVRCTGKGRKQRCTPLHRETAALITAWLRERHGQPGDPVFPTARGATLSRDAVERLVTRHTKTAQRHCASLTRKHVSPHALRHTAAMELLRHGVDRAVIALWLGHESMETTQIYLHADMRITEQALARTSPAGVTPGRYRPTDRLLAFLEGL